MQRLLRKKDSRGHILFQCCAAHVRVLTVLCCAAASNSQQQEVDEDLALWLQLQGQDTEAVGCMALTVPKGGTFFQC